MQERTGEKKGRCVVLPIKPASSGRLLNAVNLNTMYNVTPSQTLNVDASRNIVISKCPFQCASDTYMGWISCFKLHPIAHFVLTALSNGRARKL
jgi:hypothetical protein